MFLILSSFFTIPMFVQDTLAIETLSPHQQWKKLADPDLLYCKEGYLLLQKTNGIPACVEPSTYVKLIERGYGPYNSSLLSKNSDMLNNLMHYIISDEKLMYHWHEMMKNDFNVMQQSIDDWIVKMKNDPQLLKNFLGPLSSDSNLRAQMIQTMKNHPTMEFYLKQNPTWMKSIHEHVRDVTNNSHGSECSTCGVDSQITLQSSCLWCPEFHFDPTINISPSIPNNGKTMDLLHNLWLNAGMRKQMHHIMIEDPSHMAQMSEQIMEPILYSIMDNEILRSQMMNLLLENNEFMNSIRHAALSDRH